MCNKTFLFFSKPSVFLLMAEEERIDEQPSSREGKIIEIESVSPGRRRVGSNRYKLNVNVINLNDSLTWLKENFRRKIADLIKIEENDFVGLVIYSNLENVQAHALYLPFQKFSAFEFNQVFDLVDIFTISKTFIDLSKSFECEVTVFKS